MAAFCIYNFTAFNGENRCDTSAQQADSSIIPSVLVWRRM
jgi:hypothetical protein